MSNNTAHLTGFFHIRKIHPATRERREISFEGWIYTDFAAFGGRHPFIATGNAAQAMLSYEREHRCQITNPLSDLPNQTVLLDARGKLVSFSGQSYLHILNAYCFDTTYPISQKQYVLNKLTLAGHLTLKARKLSYSRIGNQTVEMVEAVVATDQKQNGGHHPVMIPGRDAVEMLKLAQSSGQPDAPINVTIGGRLVTLNDRSYFQSTFISRGRTDNLRPDLIPVGE